MYGAKVWNWISPWKKRAPTAILACWMDTKQWMWAQWGNECQVSTVVTAIQKASNVPNSCAQLTCFEMNRILISSSVQISGLQSRRWISASVCWKWWWQCWNITTFALVRSYVCSHRNWKDIIFRFIRTYWTVGWKHKIMER